SLAIVGLGLGKIPPRGVQIAQREVGYVQAGISSGQALKVFLRFLIVPSFTGHVAHGGESEAICRVTLENLSIRRNGFVTPPEFGQQVPIELQRVRVFTVDRQGFIYVLARALEVAGA